MCDPITAIVGGLGLAASLFGGGDEPPPPPQAAVPAATPTLAARDPNAEVRVGDGAAARNNGATPSYDGFTTKRVTGKPLGGLGRGGLGL